MTSLAFQYDQQPGNAHAACRFDYPELCVRRAVSPFVVLAGAVFATVPIVVVYVIFQRRIIKGVTGYGRTLNAA